MKRKYESFIDFFDWLVENCKKEVNIPEDVQLIYDSLKSQEEEEKPIITKNGATILHYLQTCCGLEGQKAKDIALGMEISARSVSGAIRKLVTDNFVEKRNTNPATYFLTNKGKDFDVTNYLKENNNV